MTTQEKIIEALERQIAQAEHTAFLQSSNKPSYEQQMQDAQALRLILEMFKRGPVGFTDSDYLLENIIACEMTKDQSGDDDLKLYALPEKVN